MNTDRLKQIAEWLEEGAIHVDPSGSKYAFMMHFWKENVGVERVQEVANENNLNWVPGDCGAAMCIGGAAEQFFGDKQEIESLIENDEYDDEEYAASLLGLDNLDAQKLFYPWNHFVVGETPLTPQCAAKVIHHLIETGKVDWSIIDGISTRYE